MALEKNTDVDEYVKELTICINNKFSQPKQKKELAQVLIDIKIYKIEKFINRTLPILDFDNIKEEDILNTDFVSNIMHKGLGLMNIHLKDESRALIIERVILKVYRIIILEVLKKNPDKRAQIIAALKGGIEDFVFVEGGNKNDLPKELLLEGLPEKYYQNELVKSNINFHYWNYDLQKLNSFHEILLSENKIEKNINFVASFIDKKVNKEHRTKWLQQKGERQLIYLMYLILGTIEFKSERLHIIIPKLFVKYDGSEFTEQSLSTSHSQISEYINGRTPLPKNLQPIKEIFDRMQ